MAFLRKIKASQVVTLPFDEYVGEESYLFHNTETGCLRISDGITPGGLPIDIDCMAGFEVSGEMIWRGENPPDNHTQYPQWLNTTNGLVSTWYEEPYPNIFNSGQWIEEPQGSSGEMIWRGPNPPHDKITYTQWFNSSSGKVSTWYEDGNSAQWVEEPSGGGGDDEAGEKIWRDITPPFNKELFPQWLNTGTGIVSTWFDDGDSSQWVEEPSAGGTVSESIWRFVTPPDNKELYPQWFNTATGVVSTWYADDEDGSSQWVEESGSAINERGGILWRTKIPYYVGDIVTEGTFNDVYTCLVDHTSTNFVTDSAYWKLVGPQTIAPPTTMDPHIWIGDIPPVNKVVYPLWFNSNTGITSTWYEDGSSGQWVNDPMVAGASTAVIAPPTTPLPLQTIVNIAGDTTLNVASHSNNYLRITNAVATIVTIPTNASEAFPIGTKITFRQSSDSTTELVGVLGVTINSKGGTILFKNDSTVILMKVGTDEWDWIGISVPDFATVTPVNLVDICEITCSATIFIIDWGNGIWQQYRNNEIASEIPTGNIIIAGVALSHLRFLTDTFTDIDIIGGGSLTSLNSSFKKLTKLSTFNVNTTAGVLDFNDAWHGCSSLTTFPMINVSKSTELNSTWLNCSGLTDFPLINTSSITYFINAWNNCRTLTTFPLLDMTEAVNLSATWANCSGLTTFPTLVTSKCLTFNNTWLGCIGLTAFPALSFVQGLYFAGTFINCTNIINMPGFNLPVAISYNSMFYGCSNMVSVGTIINNNSASFENMFKDCTSLICLTNIDTTNLDKTNGMFDGCTSLTAPNAGDQTAILAGANWTNPGTCP